MLVTGASSPLGIGFAAARRMAAEGAKVALTDIDGDEVERRAAELGDAGFAAIGLTHDVAQDDSWRDAIEQTVRVFGQLNALVNNAGIVTLQYVSDVRPPDWQRQIDVNLTGPFLGCQRAIAQFRAQGGGGSIVNISSVAGLVGMPRTAAYSASKGGLRLMTKTLAIECARESIRVNSVHPGVIATAIQRYVRDAGAGAAESDAIAAMIPMGRMGRPDDIAAAIAFLVSDDAAYITGTELIVDGGLTAQ